MINAHSRLLRRSWALAALSRQPLRSLPPCGRGEDASDQHHRREDCHYDDQPEDRKETQAEQRRLPDPHNPAETSALIPFLCFISSSSARRTAERVPPLPLLLSCGLVYPEAAHGSPAASSASENAGLYEGCGFPDFGVRR
jgi:hypothetical protein